MSGRDSLALNRSTSTCARSGKSIPADCQHRRPCRCGHGAAKIVRCKRWIETEDHGMSLIRNGHAVSTRRGFLGVLFSALLALALFDPDAVTAQEVKQIKLIEKHIQVKENIALVLKYFDKLAPLMHEQDPNLRPAD